MSRIFKKVRMVWIVLPIYYDIAQTKAAKTLMGVFHGMLRKVAALAGCSALAGWLIFTGHPAIAGLAIMPVLWFLRVRFARYALERMKLEKKARSHMKSENVPQAGDTLRKLGIDDHTVAGILAQARRAGEFVIGEFDQDNNLASEIGPIPLLQGSYVKPPHFEPRTDSRVQLVLLPDALAVKKTHRRYCLFCNEGLVLDALAGVEGVPKLLKIHLGTRTLYQSFSPGNNVGTLMAQWGAPISVQHEAGRRYHESEKGGRSPEQIAERQLAAKAFHSVVGDDVASELARLFDKVHRAGVAVRDVKYGNVILAQGKPYLVDFDRACVFPKNDVGFMLARQADRGRFNYFFGQKLLTESALRSEVKALAGKAENVLYAPVYFGKGSKLGDVGSVEFGTGKWLLIKDYMPDVRHKRVIDLGSNNAVIPLEMLKRGATKVVAIELNNIYARCARLNHAWSEFIDNREYDLQVIQGRMSYVCEMNLEGFDMATAFCSLYYEPTEHIERIMKALSKSVRYFIVQCNENQSQHSGELLEKASVPFMGSMLESNGFQVQRVMRFRDYDRPLIIAESLQVGGVGQEWKGAARAPSSC